MSLPEEVSRQLKILEAHTVEITPRAEFAAMLLESLETNRPLRIKCGIDPTISDIHLGHLIPYYKMRQFQDLGHTGVVVIGDFTAQIGDPTGRNTVRNKLSSEEVKKNAEKYMDQLYTVLNPEKTEVCYQSQWFAQTKLIDMLNWASETTLPKLLGHETFKTRLDSGSGGPFLHELFYPVLQGIDSVEIRADVELGGSDQRFNVLMGRDYQKLHGQRPQVAMLTPLLTGTCGKEKMSKSLGNFIPVLAEPFDLFGKIMSIPDHLMEEYLIHLPRNNAENSLQIIEDLKSGRLHPNLAKKNLARDIVSFFHTPQIGEKMLTEFESVFKLKKAPQDMAEYTLQEDENLSQVLLKSGAFKSNGEIKRLVQQGAVSFLEGEKINDPFLVLGPKHRNQVIRVGKRFFIKIY